MSNGKIDQLLKDGDDFLQKGNLAEAEDCYQQGLKLQPGNAELLYSLGAIEMRKADFDKALQFASQALQYDNDYIEAKLLLANALFGLERYQESLEVFKSLKDLSKDSFPYVQTGLLHEKLGHWEEAEEIFRNFLEKKSLSYISRFATIGMHDYNLANADILHALGRVMQYQGNMQEAWLYYHLAKRNDPLMDIDPMFLEIMTSDDLENHPYFDNKEPVKPGRDAEFKDILVYLFKQNSYEKLSQQCKEFNLK